MDTSKEELEALRKARHNERQRGYYKANREKMAERDRAYHEANREKIAERMRAYREANREKLAEQRRAYYEANREKIAEHKRARAGMKTQFTYKLMVSQKGRCAICAVDVTSGHHLDHIVPVARGGKTVLSNLQLLCPKCNLEKSKADPVEHMQRKGKLL